MTDSSSLLAQVRSRYPEKLPPTLDRMKSLMECLGNPQDKMSNVIHVAGSNAREETLSIIQSILVSSGKSVNKYSSKHLLNFNERISFFHPSGSQPISDDCLGTCLNEVLQVLQDDEPITFFEIVSATAFLAISKKPADYTLIGAGAGGGLDPTNVISKKKLSVITPIAVFQEPVLGKTIEDVAREYASIMQPNVPCVSALQTPEVSVVLENYAREINTPIQLAGQDWVTHHQHGRLIYQDDDALLDLPLPRHNGIYQMNNAGTAIATIRNIPELTATDMFESGMEQVQIPAKLQALNEGSLFSNLASGSEIWLDSGSTRDDAMQLAQAMADFEERVQSPLHLICSMKSSSDAQSFLAPFEGLVEFVGTINLPQNRGYISAWDLAEAARDAGLNAAPQAGLEEALQTSRSIAVGPARILICGSYGLAGHVLKKHGEIP